MITRDSRLWYVGIALAILTGITGHFDLFHQAFPGAPPWVDAQIEFWAYMGGIVAGVMRMSPLPISPQGRDTAIRKNAAHASKASKAAGVASVAASTAAKASTVAVKASKVAVEESVAAAGVKGE